MENIEAKVGIDCSEKWRLELLSQHGFEPLTKRELEDCFNCFGSPY